MTDPSPETTTGPQHRLYEIALYVYRYARRWAVGQSSNPADAVIYDSCIKLLNEECAPEFLETSKTPSAASDRYLRYGAEPQTEPFTIPISAQDALVILHRYARRYTNGRGSYTAALVNESANSILSLGIALEETRRLDGTIWAADGVGGQSDGLTPHQRREALSVLPGRNREGIEVSEQTNPAQPNETELS